MGSYLRDEYLEWFESNNSVNNFINQVQVLNILAADLVRIVFSFGSTVSGDYSQSVLTVRVDMEALPKTFTSFDTF